MEEAPTEAVGARAWWWWLALGLLVLSRLLALFDGPWEADEALFSLGVLDFHVPGHRPHPPGFPGFVLSGRPVNWLVGDPLLSLRLLSALASVLGLVAMDALLRRLVNPALAGASTLAFAFVPGVWAHASRAFTTTPALALLLLALLLVLRRVEAGRPDPGPWPWLAIAYALCVRPQLVILVATLAAVGAPLLVRQAGAVGLARALGWASVAAVLVVLVYTLVALDSGGVAAYATSLRAHAGHHARAIEVDAGLPPFEQLCFVRVMGGVWGFVLALALLPLGVWRSFVRSSALGLALLACVVVVSASMLWAHHPAFPRYSVLWVASLVPWLALSLEGVATRSPVLARGVGVSLAMVGGAAAWPAIHYMRTHPLPAVAAIDAATARGARYIEHSPGTSPFARLVREAPRDPSLSAGELGQGGPLREQQRPQAHSAAVQGDGWILPGATVLRETFEIDSPAARLLGQDRYDRASLIRQGVNLGGESYRVERTPAGEPFVWLSERARLLPPAQASGPEHSLELDFVVVGDRAPQRVRARCGARELGERALPAGRQRLSLSLSGCREPVELELPDAVARGRDPRRLSLRLVHAWVLGPELEVPDASWSVGERVALAALGVELEGFHDPERFAGRPGRWISADARLRVPAAPGIVTVTLARPPFLEDAGPFVLETRSDRYEGALDDEPMRVSLRTEAPDGHLELRLRGPSFRPAQRRPENGDQRELAAIIYALSRASAAPGQTSGPDI